MKTHHYDVHQPPQVQEPSATGTADPATQGSLPHAPAAASDASARPQLRRGLTTLVASWPLQETIRLRALTLANRFRVIRTLDVVVDCFAERPFKTALSAAQRAMRGLVKAGLLARYRTDRFMTVYGLTQRGTNWLAERDVDAAASVRRVTDMTNPEHRLWAQFLTLCCEARGMRAQTEQELLQTLNHGLAPGATAVQGLLRVRVSTGGQGRTLALRPDALCFESDGVTWFEVDRSARGSDRAASLRALSLAVGATTHTGEVLRRLVIFSRSERVKKRVLATLKALAKDTQSVSLAEGRRQLKPYEEASWEVWQTQAQRLPDGRTRLVDVLAGHVIVQELPVWLPRVRLDGRDGFIPHGWFSENYLPYARPRGAAPWPFPASPLIPTPNGRAKR